MQQLGFRGGFMVILLLLGAWALFIGLLCLVTLTVSCSDDDLFERTVHVCECPSDDEGVDDEDDDMDPVCRICQRRCRWLEHHPRP